MKRREFHSLAAGLGLTLTGTQAHATTGKGTVETFMLPRHGWVPNNPHLPVILYRQALATDGDDPAALHEALFQQNGWPPQWRNGVYDFHHYHTEGHEVLGFAAGSATLLLGGPGGREVTVQGGDIALLPAGTGHKNLGSNADFLVIGAYPPDQTFDIVRNAPTPEQQARLQTLPFPNSDPVQGVTGPVTTQWKKA